MTTTTALERAIAGRELLTHPFYRRWERGEVTVAELAAYAAQYAHFEAQLPVTLAAIAEACAPGEVRDAVAANLADELGSPRPHVELLDGFIAAVGAEPADATPATAALVELYATAPARSEAFALGVVAAYEIQAAEIARTKADGLRAHYALGASGTEFWDVHASMEAVHADWIAQGIDALDDDEVLAGVCASRDAWWGFLDEREAARPAS